MTEWFNFKREVFDSTWLKNKPAPDGEVESRVWDFWFLGCLDLAIMMCLSSCSFLSMLIRSRRTPFLASYSFPIAYRRSPTYSPGEVDLWLDLLFFLGDPTGELRRFASSACLLTWSYLWLRWILGLSIVEPGFKNWGYGFALISSSSCCFTYLLIISFDSSLSGPNACCSGLCESRF